MDSSFSNSKQIEDEWVKTSVDRIITKFSEVRVKHSFRWDLKTYWEADDLGLYCFEKPEELQTPCGTLYLTGNRNFQDEGRLVFHTRHVVTLQFVPAERLQAFLQPYFMCQEVFGGPLKIEFECDEIKPIQNFCKEMNAIIHKELMDLKGKRVQQIFNRMYQQIEPQECESRLKSRFYYLKELMVKFKNNPILYRPELERMKLI